MRKTLMLVLALGLAAGGCAWGSDAEKTTQPQAQQVNATEASPAAAPAAAKADDKKTGKNSAKSQKAGKSQKKASKSKKTEAQIAAELNTVGHKLASQAARTVMPNKHSKKVTKVGKEYVATYIDVDAASVQTEMRPGSGAAQYVGFVRYQEKVMECRGATKQAALDGKSCKQVKTRNLNELIHYDGSWQY